MECGKKTSATRTQSSVWQLAASLPITQLQVLPSLLRKVRHFHRPGKRTMVHTYVKKKVSRRRLQELKSLKWRLHASHTFAGPKNRGNI